MPTPLTPEAIVGLRRQYPSLRDDYFDYLSSVGWGETDEGQMIYEGPVDSDEIYGPRDDLASIILLGDDFQGCCFAYDAENGCYGEVADDGEWRPWPELDGIARYVARFEDNAR